MNDLDALAPDELCRAENEPHLERPFGRRRMEGQAEFTDQPRELSPGRAGQPNFLPELAQAVGQLDALVIGTAAAEQRV